MTSLLKEQLTRYELGCEGGCELMEIICPNGLKGGVRPGLGDGVIRLGLKPQRGRDTIGPYKYIIYIYIGRYVPYRYVYRYRNANVSYRFKYRRFQAFRLILGVLVGT